MFTGFAGIADAIFSSFFFLIRSFIRKKEKVGADRQGKRKEKIKRSGKPA